jgi:hypothetical protein
MVQVWKFTFCSSLSQSKKIFGGNLKAALAARETFFVLGK